jgi:UDPglucose--hexose-1-phosphate uridylyltransferase
LNILHLTFSNLLMPELRIDPLTSRRVIIAENRAGRPNDFAGTELSPVESNTAPHGDCPFCPGNESQTPHEKQQVCDEQGRWIVRVVPNRFPSVEINAPIDNAHGLHEVIIESRDHVSRVNQVSAAHWADVLRVHVERLEYAATIDTLRYALLFKNVGASGGASLSHLHSQFLALPVIPPSMQTELAALRAYHETHGKCGWCDRIAAERTSPRFVAERDGLIAFCPAVARQPFETWILPVEHAADFPDVSKLDRAAGFIHDILCRVERAIGSAGYNVMVQTSPLRGIDPRHFHWRIEILPRVTPLAGLELATGTHVCSLAPERAAQALASAATPNPR